MEWNHGMESWNHGIMEWMEWNGMEWNKKVLVHTHTRAQFLPDI